jgi:hypothetical protein
MFQEMFSPIIGSTLLYLQLLICSPMSLPAGVMDELERSDREHSIDARQTLPVSRSSCLSPTYCDPGLTYDKFSQRCRDGTDWVPVGEDRGEPRPSNTFPSVPEMATNFTLSCLWNVRPALWNTTLAPIRTVNKNMRQQLSGSVQKRTQWNYKNIRPREKGESSKTAASNS